MIETFTRCASCKTDTRLGIEIHCVLCHANYAKGEQHACKAIDEVISETEPSTIPDRFKNARLVFDKPPTGAPRTPWPGSEYHPHAVPKE